MNLSFDSIEPERKRRILNAAFKEFARKGYKHASTNRIVEEAGIGKGPLFSYFGSKAGLFEYLVKYCNDFINEFMLKVHSPENDIDLIEKYKIASKLKFSVYIKEPYIFEFLIWLYFNPNEIKNTTEIDELKKYIENAESVRDNFFNRFKTKPNVSKFRTDIPVERQIKYIGWVMDGYIKYMTDATKAMQNLHEIDFTPYWEEFDVLIDELKILFYNE